MLALVAAAADGGGGSGPRAGIVRPGGPRTGSVCGPLCVGELCPALAVVLCGTLRSAFDGASRVSRHSSLNPSTNANLPSLFNLSKSRPPPFLASCFQNSNSLIHDTSTTLLPCSSPPASLLLLSASYKNRMISQFAVAPSVLVSRRSESSRGGRTKGWRWEGMRVDGGIGELYCA